MPIQDYCAANPIFYLKDSELENLKEGGTNRFLLVEEDELFLIDYGLRYNGKRCLTPKRLIRKFTRCFRQVWQQIPDHNRTVLMNYWRGHERQEPEYQLTRQPLIEINNLRFDQAGDKRAGCSRCGFALTFSVRSVNDLPAKKLRCLIAHELGHAMSAACGWTEIHTPAMCLVSHDTACPACELQANSYMESWAFRHSDIE